MDSVAGIFHYENVTGDVAFASLEILSLWTWESGGGVLRLSDFQIAP
jgi:hypothetical protein